MRVAAFLLLLALLVGCGRAGPPVRAPRNRPPDPAITEPAPAAATPDAQADEPEDEENPS